MEDKLLKTLFWRLHRLTKQVPDTSALDLVLIEIDNRPTFSPRRFLLLATPAAFSLSDIHLLQFGSRGKTIVELHNVFEFAFMNYFCSIFFLFRHWGLYQPIGYNGSYLFKSYFPFSNLTTTRAKWVLNTKSAVFAAICQPMTRNTRTQEEEQIASYFNICLSVLLYVCPFVCSFFCLCLSFCLSLGSRAGYF